MVPNLKIDDPKPQRVLNDFIYRVRYRINKETIARIEQQLKLFPDR